MKNIEKFSDKILDILSRNRNIAILNGDIGPCDTDLCDICACDCARGLKNLRLAEWLQKEAEECSFKEDDIVEVSDSGSDHWVVGQFVGKKDGLYLVNVGTFNIRGWKYCVPYGTVGSMMADLMEKTGREILSPCVSTVGELRKVLSNLPDEYSLTCIGSGFALGADYGTGEVLVDEFEYLQGWKEEEHER